MSDARMSMARSTTPATCSRSMKNCDWYPAIATRLATSTIGMSAYVVTEWRHCGPSPRAARRIELLRPSLRRLAECDACLCGHGGRSLKRGNCHERLLRKGQLAIGQHSAVDAGNCIGGDR